MATETKKERFERISIARRDKVLDAVRLLENCSNKSNYEYTKEEVDEIFSDIEDAVAEAKARFAGSEKHNGIKNFKKSFESEYTWLAGFMRNVDRFGDKEALHSPRLERKWTYKELNAEANRFANGILKKGVTKGDVVMFQLLNCPEFVFAYLECHKPETDWKNTKVKPCNIHWSIY